MVLLAWLGVSDMDLKIFAKTVEHGVYEQLEQLMSTEVFKDAKVRIMPDTHSGTGCVIGFTADLGSKVVPNLVGVDIGCGMFVCELGKIDASDEVLEGLDKFIHENIPAGLTVNDADHCIGFAKLKDLKIFSELKKIEWLHRSICSLGSGNHYIELDKDSDGNIFLVIHTGSRNLGIQVCNYYQKMAKNDCKKRGISIDSELSYLEGEHRDDYLNDMKLCQEFAVQNREEIARRILKFLNVESVNSFHTVHNYIDFEDNIVRKGAIRCNKGERVIIPLNMRDGSIIGIGKGNPDWNCSGCHGAGRLMSRKEARESISIEDFKSAMNGVFTTSVNESTLDESPMAYKDAGEIISLVKDTVDIVEVIKPIYNFKSSV